MLDVAEQLERYAQGLEATVEKVDRHRVVRGRARTGRRVLAGVAAGLLVAGGLSLAVMDRGNEAGVITQEPTTSAPVGVSTTTAAPPATAQTVPDPLTGEQPAAFRDPVAAAALEPFDAGGVTLMIPPGFSGSGPVPVAQETAPEGQRSSVNYRFTSPRGEDFNVTIQEYTDPATAAEAVAQRLQVGLSQELLSRSATGTALVLDYVIEPTAGWHSTVTATGPFVIQVNARTVPVDVLHDIALASTGLRP